MRTREEMISMVEILYEKDLIYYVITSLFSSDNFFTKEDDYKQNIERLTEFCEYIKDSNIPSNKKEMLIQACKTGVQILNDELKYFLNFEIKKK